MIQRFYRFAKGVLTVSVTGRSVTRFINLCIKAGIPVWGMACTDAMQLTFCMYLQDVYELRPFLRKTHVKMRIRKRQGLPFFMRRYRARKVFAAVVVLAVFGVLWLSTRIWRIEIIGNSSIGEDTMLKYLKEQNISYGTAKEYIDNDSLELLLRQDFDAVIWASVYTEGTKLVVCVQEKIATDRPEESGSLCLDLVAGQDAQIVSIITRSGTAQVAAGDQVKAGDVLVSGRQEILDDNGEVKEYYYQSADADVMGNVIYDYEDWIPEIASVVQPTGKLHNQYYLTIDTYQLMLPNLFAEFDEYESLEKQSQLCIMDSFYFPVYFGHIRYIEQETVEITRSAEDAKSIALKNLDQFLEDLRENGVSILDKNVMMEKVGNQYHIYGKISASESITEPALTEILPQPFSAQEEESNEFE